MENRRISFRLYPKKQALAKLHYARKLQRKASKRWKKASRRVARLQTKISNQRKDWVHKVAAEIVRGNSLVAT
ncbi:MAG: transposase, partial [Xenococcaceae cyanobacterium]